MLLGKKKKKKGVHPGSININLYYGASHFQVFDSFERCIEYTPTRQVHHFISMH